MEQIIDDLGSLSDPIRLSQPSSGGERWRWLLPWTWILGAWSTATRSQADFLLDVTVRGTGLETCSSVRASATASLRWARLAFTTTRCLGFTMAISG
jgi:hypothetical protein